MILDGTAILVSDGDCRSSEGEVEVSFTNSHTASRLHLVYVTGGDDITGVKPELAEDGLDEHFVEVAAVRAGDNGKETITVTRSMSDDTGTLYLVGYTQDAATANPDPVISDDENLDDDSTTFGGDADFVVEVVFHGSACVEER